jgi:SSS family solute:Na+ symporter
VAELQGLVWGMVNEPEATDLDEPRWWNSPYLLGFTALAIAAILTIIFF